MFKKLTALFLICYISLAIGCVSSPYEKYETISPAQSYVYESDLYTFRVNTIVNAVESGIIPESFYLNKILPIIETGNTWLNAFEGILRTEQNGFFVDPERKQKISQGIASFASILNKKLEEGIVRKRELENQE